MSIPNLRREFRAVWVATVQNLDWPSKQTLSPAQQRAELVRIFDLASELKLNAIVLQVRPQSDALYASTIEPWSEYLTGRMGRPPEPFYDPLEFAVSEAHNRGLELHAWFNPYRALVNRNSPAVAPNHITRTHPNWIRSYGPYALLDPGEPDAPGYISSVVRDVVSRYDIDGVHFDDYFYPYPDEHATPFPDDSTWNNYQGSGGQLGRADWRRQNVNELVQHVAAEIKSVRAFVKFGISPFGIWRSDQPVGTRGLSAFDELFADSRKWLREGWVDYLTPQLYWRIAEPHHGYASLLRWWIAQKVEERHVWAGNAVSKINVTTFSAAEIVEQIKQSRAASAASGNVYFSASAFVHNLRGINEALKNGPYAEPALVPAFPWLGHTPPAAPQIIAADVETTRVKVSWRMEGSVQPSLWCLYAQREDIWETLVLPGRVASWTLKNEPGPLSVIALSAVDRLGNESELTMVSMG